MIEQPTSKKPTCCLPILIVALILLLIPILFYLTGVDRNDKLLSGKRDSLISKELNEIANPVIDKINLYKSEHGEYPETIEALIPTYIKKIPSEYLGGRVIYQTDPYYGVPFYFAFRGNYSGRYFLHGWAIIYCPVSMCEISGPPSRRIDDNWIFVHSSAF